MTGFRRRDTASRLALTVKVLAVKGPLHLTELAREVSRREGTPLETVRTWLSRVVKENEWLFSTREVGTMKYVDLTRDGAMLMRDYYGVLSLEEYCAYLVRQNPHILPIVRHVRKLYEWYRRNTGKDIVRRRKLEELVLISQLYPHKHYEFVYKRLDPMQEAYELLYTVLLHYINEYGEEVGEILVKRVGLTEAEVLMILDAIERMMESFNKIAEEYMKRVEFLRAVHRKIRGLLLPSLEREKEKTVLNK